jgi:putative acetyltransferase
MPSAHGAPTCRFCAVIDITIRSEQAGDAASVRQVNERAFGTPAEADLIEALRGSDGSISLVATVGGAIVGHIMFTPVTLDAATAVRAAGLAPMSVLPAHQRAGVGTRLVRAGLAACREQGYTAVVVVGHPSYYPRFGFTPAHTYGLQCEFDVPREAFMVTVLDPQVLPHLAGVVRYRPEFAAV